MNHAERVSANAAQSTNSNAVLDNAPLRLSRYCHVTESLVAEQQFLVFNSFTGSLLELDAQEYRQAQTVLEGQALTTGNEQLDTRLYDAGVLVPEDLDELSVIRERRNQRHLNKDFFGLTIAPTLQCNFRCDYCFEEHPNQRMSADTEAALCEFIREKSRAAKGISITWYGGEPLLALQSVVRIQTFINELAEERGIPVYREMITNGYLLSPKAVEALTALGEWQQIQVTLDGEAETHDTRRVLVNGKGTWQKIVNNCQNALDHGLPLVIRMNVDASTSLDFDDVVSQLLESNILQRAGIYLGCVASATPQNQHIESVTLQRKQFADAKLTLSTQLLNEGLPAGVGLPAPECTLCTADIDNGYVIAPTGLIFKCWEEIAMGEDVAIGHLTKPPTIQQKLNADTWSAYDPLQKSGCANCTALPVCMGGCPLHAKKNQGNIGDCSSFRFHPLETIQIAHAEMAINKHLETAAEI